MSGTAVVMVAAGRGTRASQGGPLPKQYVALCGRAVLAHALAPFLAVGEVSKVVVVVHADDHDAYERAVAPLRVVAGERLLPAVNGGGTRQASVLAGLEAIADAPGAQPDRVLIHDAARPFIEETAIEAVIAALSRTDGAIAAEPLADTLKRETADGSIAETVPRAGLWRAQTPQGFQFAAILRAHRDAAKAGLDDFTDDAAIAEWAGMDVALVAASAGNWKLTTSADIALAEERMRSRGATETMANETRTGSGFDVHRFADGDHLWLCGVRIPHEQTLEGHSDADVGLHALTDAILGAIGDGDIGQHFPPSDPQWKGAASDQFLADACRRVASRKGRFVNVDVTLLCEMPKIGPYRETMRQRIAEIMDIDVDRVGVKATTTERLGFTGRREGIAAMATASVELPVPASTR